MLRKLKDHLGAIRLARELRAVFLAEFGPQDYFSIQAAMELAQLLEIDTVRHEEAVHIYEDICRLPVEGARCDSDDLATLIRRARERLAELLAS